MADIPAKGKRMPPRSRFQFSERARPLTLDDRDPAVCGYAWVHPSPRATLVVLHGLQSHAQWFAEAADGLLDRGLSVYALERCGSGSSPGRSGDISRYQSWFDEAGRLVDFARAQQPEVPIHLLGHCFGANVALGVALERPDDVASLIMLTPGLHITPGYTPAEKVRIATAGLLSPQRRFRVPQEDGLFTRDPDVLAWIEADSLGSKMLSARCLLQTGRMVSSLRRRLGDLAIPLLVIEAAQDRIADNDANTDLLDRRLGGGWERISFEAEHFLLAEPCRDEVLDEIVAWVAGDRSEARTASPSRRRSAGTDSAAAVSAVEVCTAELPFRFSFGHALAERSSSTNVYVKVTLADGTVGYGEGVPRGYVTGETAQAALTAVSQRYAPALLGRELSGPDDVPEMLEAVAATVETSSAGPPGAAWCAVELAILDAAGRRFGVPVSHWLGPVRAPVLTYDAVLPFSKSAAVVPLATLIRGLGITHVKLKVGRDLGGDVHRLRLLRNVLGAEADVRVDANCAWTVEQALLSIEALRRYGISAVEQPLAADDVAGLQRLTADCPELIIVDESLRTIAEARALVDAKACDAFNIRVSKCGGLRTSMSIAEIAGDAGLTVVVGAQVGESGILSAAGRHLAACVAPRYLEGSAGRLLLREDITRERVLPGRAGRARPHAGAGLGVTVKADVLARHTLQARVVEA
jgi:L-alanine-DL-glutamate epimerase-like enolase superfamily enzyme/alpha-beta hydrolase superfamily lysophospholipase